MAKNRKEITELQKQDATEYAAAAARNELTEDKPKTVTVTVLNLHNNETVLPTDRCDLIAETAWMVKEFKSLVADGYYEIGRRLIALKEGVEHGQWIETLDRIGINDRAARRMMQAYRFLFSSPEYKQLPMSSVLEISNLDDSELDDLGPIDELDGLTRDELKARIKEIKATQDELNRKMGKGKNAYRDLQIRFDQMKERNAALEAGQIYEDNKIAPAWNRLKKAYAALIQMDLSPVSVEELQSEFGGIDMYHLGLRKRCFPESELAKHDLDVMRSESENLRRKIWLSLVDDKDFDEE